MEQQAGRRGRSSTNVFDIDRNITERGGLDVTSTDVDGKLWDISQTQLRNRAARRQVEEQLQAVITNDMRDPWSSINNVSPVQNANAS